MSKTQLLLSTSQMRIDENFKRIMDRLDAMDALMETLIEKQGGAENAGHTDNADDAGNVPGSDNPDKPDAAGTAETEDTGGKAGR